MTSLVLSVWVMTSSGGLLAERTPAAGMLLGAVDLGAPPLLEHMSLAELTTERTRLLETMPSMGLGIALTVVGGGVLLTGLVIAAATYITEVIIVGLVVMAASVPLLIIGPILLAHAARERREVQSQVRLIDQRMTLMQHQEFAPPPTQRPVDETPPPPPMRPPGVEVVPGVAPQILLATF